MNPVLMALLLLAGWGFFAVVARKRWKLMMVGAPADRSDQPAVRFRAMFRYAIAQLRMRRYPISGMAHSLVFIGFAVLLLRTLMLWGRGFDESFDLWFLGTGNIVGQLYTLAKDAFVVLVIIGALIFLHLRVVQKLPRLTHSTEALIILLIILVMMVADILYDGAVLAQAHAGNDHGVGFVWYEPAGSLAGMALAGLPEAALSVVKHAGFWTHSALVLIFLNILPFSKHFHVITAIPNVYLQDLSPPGRLPLLEDIEGKLEREETLGVKKIDQFSWKAILDFYTCTECGRCSDHCPAASTGKKLSPKHFTIDLRDFLYKNEQGLVAAGHGSDGNGSAGEDATPEHAKDLVDGVIDPEVLWACTTCRACEQECPVFISYVDKIVDMRRYLVQERGEFPNELQTAFQGLEVNGNPWSFPATDRDAWTSGLDIKLIAEHPEVPVLFWVGCAPSFDDRAKTVTRATAQLLQRAGVDFAILGQEEQCTGDPARRAGNEYLFQMFATANVEVLNGYGVDKKTVITTCPHCFNTLLNEYPDFGGMFDVVHHTTYLARLVREGKLTPKERIDKKVAYHDSCYLGRYNEVYDAPREALESIPGLSLVEPEETRDRGMCCGAGGAQMFKEEEEGDDRVNIARTRQLLKASPDAISSACPFCSRMLIDGLADQDKEDMEQLDVAELLLQSVGENGQAT
ncbi:MAG: (Fe-S)-binding protein [Planctomycetota bacterium]|jgi:Fe-S oxidoreductase/nitrate reductase gamma subunit